MMITFDFLSLMISTILLIVGSREPVSDEHYVASSNTSAAERNNNATIHPDIQELVTEDPSADSLLISTLYGLVRGTYSDGVRMFHGVPYARPPVGDLRWQPPVEPHPWSPEVFNATKIRPGCPQDCSLPFFCGKTTSEDCLFLEITVPAKVKSPVPVMVYIHGGSFKDATATLAVYDATKFVKRSNVIVVHVEYRLGALGFLVTGTGKDQATGNYGLLDQRQALIWVKNNIQYFGGDPGKVTLAGQSAGAQSALIHLFSNVSSQYFNSVILESVPLSLPYRTSKVASEQGKTLATILKCTNRRERINMTCLRTRTATEIIAAQKKSTDGDFGILDKVEPYAPVLDGDLVKMQALDALKHYAESSNQIKPMIWGYATEEALLFVNMMLPFPVDWLLTKMVLTAYVGGDLTDEIEQLYPITSKSDTREDISRAITDFGFRCPMKHSIKLLKNIGRSKGVWLYTWDRPLTMEFPTQFAVCKGRVCHNTEIPFIFQTFSSLSNVTNDKDIEMSNYIIDYYTNFIKYENPNGNLNKQSNSNTTYNEELTGRAEILIDWPSVFTNMDKGISRLIFSRDGKLRTVTDVTDNFCDIWDKTGYTILLQEIFKR